MKKKIIDNLISVLFVVALFCLIGGGLWWGATAAYGWLGDWARGKEVRHEWHLEAGAMADTQWTTSGGGAETNVLWQVHLKDGPDGDTERIGGWGSEFDVNDAWVEIVKPPKHGTATIAHDGTLKYKADDDYVGSDSVTWSVKLDRVPETVTGVLPVEVEPEPESTESWVPPGKRWPGAFENCAEAQAQGRAPVRKGERGYAPWLDADGDGVGCDAG
ncbi:excalibur calcium-binding domain-containing protein [Streptomyces flaveolus]|uniref:excalibur calcium-binding domain-containing protein n=1 Tax=Streptomyces flaveolus TaxID=67297 RepID=UPI00333349B9